MCLCPVPPAPGAARSGVSDGSSGPTALGPSARPRPAACLEAPCVADSGQLWSREVLGGSRRISFSPSSELRREGRGRGTVSTCSKEGWLFAARRQATLAGKEAEAETTPEGRASRGGGGLPRLLRPEAPSPPRSWVRPGPLPPYGTTVLWRWLGQDCPLIAALDTPANRPTHQTGRSDSRWPPGLAAPTMHSGDTVPSPRPSRPPPVPATVGW